MRPSENGLTRQRARLVLADGTVFTGEARGAFVESTGEVVFNTSMTGYPEILTDPSYRGQIVTLTYPEIGNYGVTRRDAESDRVQVAGLISRAASPVVSNWRSDLDLSSWLREAGVPWLAGVDTRALVRHIRDEGAMMGIVHTGDDADLIALHARARALPGMAGMALADMVCVRAPTPFTEGLLDDDGRPVAPLSPPRFHVVAVDLGMKKSIARLLVHHGARVTIVPASTSADAIRALAPDGVFLSNGPGDPATAVATVDAVKSLVGTVPIFGICMGHQILAQALGAKTYKTRFGHRGGNQPVKTTSGRVLITSQNHGFAVDEKALSPGAHASETNVSDGTNEGVDALDRFAFSVQYHPEAAPGPHDARPHFERFRALMERFADGKPRVVVERARSAHAERA